MKRNYFKSFLRAILVFFGGISISWSATFSNGYHIDLPDIAAHDLFASGNRFPIIFGDVHNVVITATNTSSLAWTDFHMEVITPAILTPRGTVKFEPLFTAVTTGFGVPPGGVSFDVYGPLFFGGNNGNYIADFPPALHPGWTPGLVLPGQSITITTSISSSADADYGISVRATVPDGGSSYLLFFIALACVGFVRRIH